MSANISWLATDRQIDVWCVRRMMLLSATGDDDLFYNELSIFVFAHGTQKLLLLRWCGVVYEDDVSTGVMLESEVGLMG